MCVEHIRNNANFVSSYQLIKSYSYKMKIIKYQILPTQHMTFDTLNIEIVYHRGVYFPAKLNLVPLPTFNFFKKSFNRSL